ncbi:MAG: hypothetical protein IJ195_11090 [Lachnospiraceae bacterium]|nr:hypothetical protein [Lachnospiraceae bacterium]
MRKKLLMLIGAAAMVIFAGGCGKREVIDLNKYVQVEYEGVDSIGTAVASFDTKALKRDVMNNLELTKAGVKSYDFLVEEAEENGFSSDTPELLVSCLDGSFDKADNLSNGDTITYKWNIDEEKIENLFKCNIVFSDIEFEVESLKEVKTVDLFEKIDLAFSGISPKVKVNTKGSCDYRGVHFDIVPDNAYGLKNGDTVKLVVSGDASEVESYLLEEYQVRPESLEKEYTIEGLSSYMMSASELSKETMDKMKEVTEDEIASYVAPWESGDKRRLLGYEFIGTYVRTLKEGKGGDDNTITLVYRCDSALRFKNKHSDGYFEDIVPFYFPVTFKNVTILPDGTESVNYSDHDVSYAKFSVNESTNDLWGNVNAFDYKGYENLDSLFNKFITEKLEQYDYEDNVKDTEIPEYPNAFDWVETEE